MLLYGTMALLCRFDQQELNHCMVRKNTQDCSRAYLRQLSPHNDRRQDQMKDWPYWPINELKYFKMSVMMYLNYTHRNCDVN